MSSSSPSLCNEEVMKQTNTRGEVEEGRVGWGGVRVMVPVWKK